MAYQIIHNCPVCGSGLRVTRLRCPSCNTVIEGDFQTERLLSLSGRYAQLAGRRARPREDCHGQP